MSLLTDRAYLENAVVSLLQKNLELATEEAEQTGADLRQFYENRPQEWGPSLGENATSEAPLGGSMILSPPKKEDYINFPLVKTVKNPNNTYGTTANGDAGGTKKNATGGQEHDKTLLELAKMTQKDAGALQDADEKDLHKMLKYIREKVPWETKAKIAKKILDEAKASVFDLEEYQAPLSIPGGKVQYANMEDFF
mmetsp:Transcript_19163/g.47907  ORF Transcript_19163/g.47907 Transcript_19163/m.47907 type:complete len:196 (+) Transcript_19163:284-871(+)|eukprot:g10166.t1